MKWNGTDLEQIVHYRADGQEFAACGVYAAAMDADSYHAVTTDREAVTCDPCRVRCDQPEETPLEAIRRGAWQAADWRARRG
jgi:hypothetical protein